MNVYKTQRSFWTISVFTPLLGGQIDFGHGNTILDGSITFIVQKYLDKIYPQMKNVNVYNFSSKKSLKNVPLSVYAPNKGI